MLKEKKFIFALLLAGLLLLGIGLGIWTYVNKKVGVARPGILIAQDCGMDGLQCCSNEPKCSFGQECCIDPNNPKQNQCADKCGCGSQDQFCCADNQCGAGLACVGAKCTACGDENQPCCGNACQGKDQKGNELACLNQVCVGCGAIGHPCCANDKCFGLITPERTLAECSTGICNACGGNQQAACAGLEKCLANYLLNNNNCFKCGEINEPCCDNKKCNGKNSKCLQGFCQ